VNVWLHFAAALLVAALVSPPAGADDTLAAARDLYAAAAYEEALALLNGLAASPSGPDDMLAIEKYRAYCLLALGRATEAERAIAAVVSAEPLQRPDADLSPRVLARFTDVRRRMLPIIVQSRYAAARDRFDAKQFEDAANGFRAVLALLADPDLVDLAGQPPLSDLRLLASGFHDLSVQAASPPPPPATPVASPALPVVPGAPSAPRIYAADDVSVNPPVALRQTLPSFTERVAPDGPGVLEVVVDEEGNTESVAMRVSLTPRYDVIVLDAAKKWKYEPARRDGVPVKYRRLIEISVRK
jgi:hypothetical protein